MTINQNGNTIHIPEAITLGELSAFGDKVYAHRPKAVDAVRAWIDSGRTSRIPTEAEMLEYERFNVKVFAYWAKIDERSVMKEDYNFVFAAIELLYRQFFSIVTDYDPKEGVLYKGERHFFHEMEGLNTGEVTGIMKIRALLAEKSPFGGYGETLTVLKFGAKGLLYEDLDKKIEEYSGYWDDLPLSVVNGVVFFYTKRSATFAISTLASLANALHRSPHSLAAKALAGLG